MSLVDGGQAKMESEYVMNSGKNQGDVAEKWLKRVPASLAGLVERRRWLAQAVRDVAMVVDGFSADRRPVVQHFQPNANQGLSAGERLLRVVGVRQETPSATTIMFEAPEGVKAVSGQFLTLLLPLQGKEVRRSYSLSSCPETNETTWSITVKRVEQGLVSNWIHDSIKVGDRIRTRGPSGNFTLASASKPNLLLIAGGSGITPIMSLLRLTLATRPGVPVTLLYANRSKEEVIFRAEIEKLSEQFSQLTVIHFWEQADEGEMCCSGRITRDALHEATVAQALADWDVYMCGPEAMMNGLLAEMDALAFPKANVKIERFASLRPAVLPTERKACKLKVFGQAVVAQSNQTVLEAALAAGVDHDFSCTMGGCGACKTRLVSGQVVMDDPNCLSDEEKGSGLILSCLAHPLSDVVVERI
jgi:ferredoxin-NADP reductase